MSIHVTHVTHCVILQRQLSTKLREYVEVAVSQDGSFTETSDDVTDVVTSPVIKPVSVCVMGAVAGCVLISLVRISMFFLITWNYFKKNYGYLWWYWFINNTCNKVMLDCCFMDVLCLTIKCIVVNKLLRLFVYHFEICKVINFLDLLFTPIMDIKMNFRF